MLRLHKSRVYPNGDRDQQPVESRNATNAATFVLHMLGYGAHLVAVNDHQIALVTPMPDGGYNDDSLVPSSTSEDIDLVARAVQYWCRLRGRHSVDRERENWHRCAARTPVHTYTDQFAWACTHAETSSQRLRVAVMLACGIDRIADIEAGLAIPAPTDDPDGDFLAAVDLWREHRTSSDFRDCAALAA